MTDLTPSVSAILSAYQKNGNGDVGLLKAILESKRREDERLTALANLHLEAIRAQNIASAAYIIRMAASSSKFPLRQVQPPSPTDPTHPALGSSPPPMPLSSGCISSGSHKRKRSNSSCRDVEERVGRPGSHGEVLAKLRRKVLERSAQSPPPLTSHTPTAPSSGVVEEEEETSDTESVSTSSGRTRRCTNSPHSHSSFKGPYHAIIDLPNIHVNRILVSDVRNEPHLV